MNQGLGFSSDSLCDKDCSHLAGPCFGAALTPVLRLPLNVFLHGRLAYVWRVSATQQVDLVLLRLLVFPFSMVPLELQRRLVNAAVDARDFGLMLTLAGAYVGLIIVNGPFK